MAQLKFLNQVIIYLLGLARACFWLDVERAEGYIYIYIRVYMHVLERRSYLASQVSDNNNNEHN
jgi:hypothetical protein